MRISSRIHTHKQGRRNASNVNTVRVYSPDLNTCSDMKGFVSTFQGHLLFLFDNQKIVALSPSVVPNATIRSLAGKDSLQFMSIHQAHVKVIYLFAMSGSHTAKIVRTRKIAYNPPLSQAMCLHKSRRASACELAVMLVDLCQRYLA
jgi:hypothetical protein